MTTMHFGEHSLLPVQRRVQPAEPLTGGDVHLTRRLLMLSSRLESGKEGRVAFLLQAAGEREVLEVKEEVDGLLEEVVVVEE